MIQIRYHIRTATFPAISCQSTLDRRYLTQQVPEISPRAQAPSADSADPADSWEIHPLQLNVLLINK